MHQISTKWFINIMSDSSSSVDIYFDAKEQSSGTYFSATEILDFSKYVHESQLKLLEEGDSNENDSHFFLALETLATSIFKYTVYWRIQKMQSMGRYFMQMTFCLFVKDALKPFSK